MNAADWMGMLMTVAEKVWRASTIALALAAGLMSIEFHVSWAWLLFIPAIAGAIVVTVMRRRRANVIPPAGL